MQRTDNLTSMGSIIFQVLENEKDIMCIVYALKSDLICIYGDTRRQFRLFVFNQPLLFQSRKRPDVGFCYY
jgi:hypothetical protein